MVERKDRLTEGLLIASIPAAGYWFAFLYELGICNYFGIPAVFIEVGIVNILVAILSLVGVLATMYLYTNPFFMALRKVPAWIKSSLLIAGTPTALVFGYLLVNQLTFFKFFFIVSFWIIFSLFFEFIFPLITQRRIKGYVAKLDAQRKIDLQHENLMDIAVKKMGRILFYSLSLFLVLSYIAYFSGGYGARTQKNFMVLTTTPELVVLKMHNNFFVTAQFDRLSKSLDVEYQLTPINEQLGKFKLEQVGPLLPKGSK